LTRRNLSKYKQCRSKTKSKNNNSDDKACKVTDDIACNDGADCVDISSTPDWPDDDVSASQVNVAKVIDAGQDEFDWLELQWSPRSGRCFGLAAYVLNADEHETNCNNSNNKNKDHLISTVKTCRTCKSKFSNDSDHHKSCSRSRSKSPPRKRRARSSSSSEDASSPLPPESRGRSESLGGRCEKRRRSKSETDSKS